MILRTETRDLETPSGPMRTHVYAPVLRVLQSTDDSYGGVARILHPEHNLDVAGIVLRTK